MNTKENKKEMNNEYWINEVMNSLDDVKSAEVNPFLYNQLLNKLSKSTISYTPMKIVWLAAASFAILLFLNFKILNLENKSSKIETNGVQTLASGYQLLNENTVNYN